MPPVKENNKNGETSRPPYTWDQLKEELARQDAQEPKGQPLPKSLPDATYNSQQINRPAVDRAEAKARKAFWKQVSEAAVNRPRIKSRSRLHPIVGRSQNASPEDIAANEIDAHYKNRHERVMDLGNAIWFFGTEFIAYWERSATEDYIQRMQRLRANVRAIDDLEKQIKFINEAADEIRNSEKIFVWTAWKQKSFGYNTLLWQKKIVAPGRQLNMHAKLAFVKHINRIISPFFRYLRRTK